MMDRVAFLHKTARDLQRRIYASMPFGYRVAELMLRLADGSADAFGTYLYAVFLSQGVEKMPPIRGMSPEEFLASVKSKDPRVISKKLPANYGKALGAQAQKMLLIMVKRMDIVDDVLMHWLESVVLAGKLDIRPGTDLRTAHSFVLKSLKNAALTVLRGEKRTTGLPEDEEGVIVDIHDPRALQELEEAFGGLRKMPADLKSDLRGVAEWAPEYLGLSLEGYTDDEIFGFEAGAAVSGSKPSILATRLNIPFVPRPGSKEPLNRGWWSKPRLGVKERIMKTLVDYFRDESVYADR